MFAQLRDLIFTPGCIGCGELGQHLCLACSASLAAQESRNIAGLDRVLTAHAYDGWLRDAVIEYKNGSRRHVYGLAQVLHQVLRTCGEPDSVTVVPMPSSQAKIAVRGFDTTNLLVRESMKLQPHPLGSMRQVLYVSRNVVDQVGLTAEQRAENVANSMAARHEVTGTVVVVDDVITTGSTLREAARALRLAGARKVFGISLCGSSKWE